MNAITEPTGKGFIQKMIDWAIEGLEASQSKHQEAQALTITGAEYIENKDMLAAGIVLEKYQEAMSYSSQFYGEAMGYMLAARVYASEHKVDCRVIPFNHPGD